MKTSRYSEAQIMAILRQAEGGVPVAQLCREHGMSDASFYKWRAKYGGMDASMVSQMKAIEDENRRLRRMYADLSMQNDLLKEALGKMYGHLSAGRWPRKRWYDEASALRWHVGRLASARPAIATARN
ncbi:transposase-like protein [Roseovarius sp. MBR-51]